LKLRRYYIPDERFEVGALFRRDPQGGDQSLRGGAKRVSDAFGKRGYVPVKGTLNGHPVWAMLVPMGKGRHRFFVNGEKRKTAGVDAGDRIELTLEIDTGPREVPMPDAFALALRKNPAAHAAFLRIPLSHQKEYLVYMNTLKNRDSGTGHSASHRSIA
jgi:hypothetical protein